MEESCEFGAHLAHRHTGVHVGCDENPYIVTRPALKRPVWAALPPKPILAGVGETDGGEDLFVVQVLGRDTVL